MTPGELVLTRGEQVLSSLFPLGETMISMAVELRGGRTVEVASVGREGAVGHTRVGVRGATADGLPLAGPAGSAGLHLALAPRRNGWLMGPLVARIVADGIEGRAPIADAAALDPLRFA